MVRYLNRLSIHARVFTDAFKVRRLTQHLDSVPVFRRRREQTFKYDDPLAIIWKALHEIKRCAQQPVCVASRLFVAGPNS